MILKKKMWVKISGLMREGRQNQDIVNYIGMSQKYSAHVSEYSSTLMFFGHFLSRGGGWGLHIVQGGGGGKESKPFLVKSHGYQ